MPENLYHLRYFFCLEVKLFWQLAKIIDIYRMYKD